MFKDTVVALHMGGRVPVQWISYDFYYNLGKRFIDMVISFISLYDAKREDKKDAT